MNHSLEVTPEHGNKSNKEVCEKVEIKWSCWHVATFLILDHSTIASVKIPVQAVNKYVRSDSSDEFESDFIWWVITFIIISIARRFIGHPFSRHNKHEFSVVNCDVSLEISCSI